MMLYGNDMDETTTLVEAGLGWITLYVKGATATLPPPDAVTLSVADTRFTGLVPVARLSLAYCF